MGKVPPKRVQWDEAVKLGVGAEAEVEAEDVGEVDTAGEVQVGGGVKEVIHPVQVNPAIVISGLRQLLTYMWSNLRRVLVQMSPFQHTFLIFSSCFSL